ncbi:MAG TPA: methyl-accepting chemotaxis protein, partial [Rhizobacter sp.]|nr:methyl-accepting chemotaxis protein [Rhizobacter sp.]
ALGKSGDSLGATDALTRAVVPAESAWRAQTAALLKLEGELNESSYRHAASVARGAQVFTLAAVLVAVSAGVVLAGAILRSVSGPIEQAIGISERIADGDLRTPIDPAGPTEVSRLLQSLASMQEQLRNVVSGISQAADNIQTASTEVAVGTFDLSQRTERAASNLQLTAASVERLTGSTVQSKQFFHDASILVKSTSEAASRGGDVVARVVDTMNEISGSSRKIADITGVIDGIAFQTNILALNAAVEAARAGEQGRGFAVVASEVRSLAQRAATAAKEIKSLIEKSSGHVDAGANLVGDAGRTMDDIVNLVRKVSSMIGEISETAQVQATGIGEINAAVGEIDHMTQQNSALVEQSSAAAEHLKEQSRLLAATVSTFRLV